MRLRYPAVLIAALAALGAVNASGAETIQEFLGRHWRRPLPPQGPPPARFSSLEASLQPEACGSCHPAQLADWTTSLHARSMGPGVAGQLVEMLASDPGSALGCLTCHAPLAEQAPRVAEGARGACPASGAWHVKQPSADPGSGSGVSTSRPATPGPMDRTRRHAVPSGSCVGWVVLH